MSKLEKSLLPQGFHDNLPPEALGEVFLNRTLVNSMRLFGYELVRPAIMEFEESLDKDFSSDFFKVTDTISGKMMVLRNDITPQIARIVKDRYGSDASGKTIRLAYTGQVIRKLGKGKFTERQLTQTGYELVSENSAIHDAEILYIAIESFEKAGLKDFTIDLVYPKLVKILLKGKFSDDEMNSLIESIETKDMQAIKADARTGDIVKIIEICDQASDIKTAIKALDKLTALSLSREVNEIFSRIKEVLEILSRSVDDVRISLNLLEVMGFSYHNGLCYSFISRKTFDEVGRGGRYKISLTKDHSVSATGFTFLVNSLLRTVKVDTKMESKKLSYKEGFSESRKLREKGTATIFE